MTKYPTPDGGGVMDMEAIKVRLGKASDWPWVREGTIMGKCDDIMHMTLGPEHGVCSTCGCWLNEKEGRRMPPMCSKHQVEYDEAGKALDAWCKANLKPLEP